MDGNSIGRAGAATVSITPPNPVPTYGGHYLVRGQEDSDILAHAVVFSDGVQTGAVVSADVLVIDRCTILWIKELASLRTGIPQDNIFRRRHPLTRGAGRFAHVPRGRPARPFLCRLHGHPHRRGH